MDSVQTTNRSNFETNNLTHQHFDGEVCCKLFPLFRFFYFRFFCFLGKKKNMKEKNNKNKCKDFFSFENKTSINNQIINNNNHVNMTCLRLENILDISCCSSCCSSCSSCSSSFADLLFFIIFKGRLKKKFLFAMLFEK